MKQLIIFILALTFPFTVHTQDKQTKKQEKKYTITILDFNVISGVQKIEAMALTSKFRGSLAKTQKYTVLERNEMETILKVHPLGIALI